MFTCYICRGLFHDPVTISCGHTFCRKCLERDLTKTHRDPACKECGIVHFGLKPTNTRTNVVLSNLIKTWFPDRSKAAELKTEGNRYFERKDFERAIILYSEAIALYDADHLLFSNRSHAYASLQQYDKAQEDAERVVAMCPNWPKGFFRKGNALFELGHYEDAAVAFLQCLALDNHVVLAKENLSRSLHMVLSKPAPDDVLKRADRQREYDASKFQVLVDGSVSMDALQPHLSVDTWHQLKQIMDDLVMDESIGSSSLPSSPATSSHGMAADSGIENSGTETDIAEIAAEVKEKQRCQSVPVLEHIPMDLEERCRQQRSRSQSPDRKGKEQDDSRHDDHQSGESHQLQPLGSKVETDVKEIDPSLLNVEDVECSLCYRLFYQPVTTRCGHTFCRQCLDRCLDHQTSCPMCKSSLAEYLAERRSAVTECLQTILTTYFPKEHEERQQIHEEEINELARMGLDRQHDIPIFVCTLGFPTVPCPLHIFEPRYRLMVRQCMESGTRQFGMCACLGESEEEFSEYGCMLEVRDVHFFPDGRSLVDTVGGRRFRVLSRGKRDGYNTAKVEFLQDDPINETDLAEIQSDQEEVYRSIQTWLAGLPLLHRARISQHFGNLPERDQNPTANPNGPAWTWWCIAVLPLDPVMQLNLLASGSFKERLRTLKQVLSSLGSRYR
ncbi:LON peptidase N-terminal domain and RING finger protein 1-like [Babylonia areolata]|uniref:LON peptidase N-terminal domain and RING finger protein 1-like n=1 Tax=Babylonia areolata TaxID=304850 RepID=UPI003FD5E67D